MGLFLFSPDSFLCLCTLPSELVGIVLVDSTILQASTEDEKKENWEDGYLFPIGRHHFLSYYTSNWHYIHRLKFIIFTLKWGECLGKGLGERMLARQTKHAKQRIRHVLNRPIMSKMYNHSIFPKIVTNTPSFHGTERHRRAQRGTAHPQMELSV